MTVRHGADNESGYQPSTVHQSLVRSPSRGLLVRRRQVVVKKELDLKKPREYVFETC